MKTCYFCRRALRDFLTVDYSPSPPAVPPGQGLTQQGDHIPGYVDLPAVTAAQALQSSVAVRVVFAPPWLSGAWDYRFPLPPGFTTSSHRVNWFRVELFSDVVTPSLKYAGIAFAGLVCPRKGGEEGIRVPEGADLRGLQNCVTAALAGMVRSHLGGPRSRLRASGAPLALLDRLHLVVSRLNVDLRLVEQRIVRCGYDSLVADLTVKGVMDSGEVWSLSGLGSRPVVVLSSSTRHVPAPI